MTKYLIVFKSGFTKEVISCSNLHTKLCESGRILYSNIEDNLYFGIVKDEIAGIFQEVERSKS